MIKKSILLLFGLVVLQCVFSSPAAAQSNPCLAFQTWWNTDGSAPLGWFFFSSYPGTFAISIAAWRYQCHPVNGPRETCPCANAQANAPISLASGDTYIEESDVRLPGLGGGLTLKRTWNSMWPASQSPYQIGIFGPNWRSNFEERIFIGSDHYIKYGRGDGSFWSFGYDTVGGNWKVAAPGNAVATLVQGVTNWTLTFQNGEQRLFSIASGRLIAIVDRNGNTTQLSYDSLNRLVTVTDPVSRHLYFGYGSGSYLVTSVTSDFGESVSYSYDSQGRLSQVTEPDASTLSFQYDSNSFISAVLDSNNKVLEAHTYDSSGRGLTGTRANGVDAVTISY